MWYSFLSTNNSGKLKSAITRKSPSSSSTSAAAAAASSTTAVPSQKHALANYQLLSQNDPSVSVGHGDNDDDDDEDFNLNNSSICCSLSESSFSDDFEFDQLSVRSRTGTIMSAETGNSYEELVGSKKRKNRKRILIGAAVGVVVAAAIVLAVVLLTRSDAVEPAQDQAALSLEDILEGRFSSKKFNGSWISDNEILYRDFKTSDVVVFDANTKTKRTLLDTADESLAQGFKFEISADQKYLLVGREYQKIFRHSFAAKYDIIDLQTNQKYPVQVNGQTDLIFAEWTPSGNGLIFVFQNNIYYMANPTANPVQITIDGDRSIYNGVPDWVYEEEIFASNKANWVSPDGTKLVYIRFDDTPTVLMNIPVYGPPGNLDYQYTRQFGIHYPKAGTPNPIVRLFYVDLAALQPGVPPVRQEILAPTDLPSAADQIISSISFANNSTLIAVWMNRVQNHAYIQACQAISCRTIKHLHSTTGWVEFFTTPIYNKDGTKMAIIASQQQSSAGDYRHLTVVSTLDGITEALTSGRHIVTEILTWDDETELIFYLANTETDSHVSHVYAKRTDVPSSVPICVTCDITINGVKQTYFNAEIKPGIMALTSLGPSVPHTELYSWAWNNNEIKLTSIMEWESNADINEALHGKHGPNVLFHDVQITTDFAAKVLMLVPHNADLSGAVKYPMLIDVYAGPDSVAVTDKWSMDWGSYMATNQSVVYVRIDGRGSGLRGDRILHAIYRKLGTLEIEDQISTAVKLAETLPYIDATRLGIWGWSYGGYASAMALVNKNNTVFKCAASVAPVTDWTYYDSIYTERYMGLPTDADNKAGYDASRLSTLATSFRGKKFLLVHGTLDDNVHYQQAMALARQLERADILFKQISYPDEDHGLAGVRPHLYHSLGHFFGDCFHLEHDAN